MKSIFKKLAENAFPPQGPRPAASAHLRWEIPDTKQCFSVEFKCDITVQKTAKCTYFSPIQFWPGGYCGIQERDNDKIAIFSIWHDDHNKVTMMDQGPFVFVEPFGGEGEGLKSIRQLDWVIGEKISFRVCAANQQGAWVTSCYVTWRGQEFLMATFRKSGAPPMQTFNSFVEDYDRNPTACGVNYIRSCELSNICCVLDGRRYCINSSVFTKNSDGVEEEGSRHCCAHTVGNSFRLSTGRGCQEMNYGTRVCL